MLYRLSNVCRFYEETLRANLISATNEQAPLVDAVRELHELTTDLFFSSLNTNVARLVEKVRRCLERSLRRLFS